MVGLPPGNPIRFYGGEAVRGALSTAFCAVGGYMVCSGIKFGVGMLTGTEFSLPPELHGAISITIGTIGTYEAAIVSGRRALETTRQEGLETRFNPSMTTALSLAGSGATLYGLTKLML